MANLSILNELIDRAAAVAGSDYKLAKMLGVGQSLISSWRVGRKPCAIEEWAIMASIAGLEADKWAIRAMLYKHEGTAKGDRLMKALGKGLLATGAAVASFGASATAIFSSTIPAGTSLLELVAWCSTMYIMFNRRRALDAAMRGLCGGSSPVFA